MKRAYTREETVAVEQFLGQATDVLDAMVWTPEQSLERSALWQRNESEVARQRREALRALRSLLSVNRASYRLLMGHDELWTRLLARLLPHQEVRLQGVPRLELMHSADLLQLYRGAMRAEHFWRAVCTGPLCIGLEQLLDDAALLLLLPHHSPRVLLDNVVRVVGVTWSRVTGGGYGRTIDWDGKLALDPEYSVSERWQMQVPIQLYAAAEPLSWLLALTVQLAERDPVIPRWACSQFESDVRQSVPSLYGNFHHRNAPDAMYMHTEEWLPPLRRLMVLWRERSEVGAAADARLVDVLRGELRWAALATQQQDTEDTLVPLDELPLSYSLFWWALQHAGVHSYKTDGAELYEHKMFHAPAPQCHQCTAPLAGECCWERAQPQVLYCDAQCFDACRATANYRDT